MEPDEKACPRCAETIKAAALVCKYCGHSFDGGGPEQPTTPAPEKKRSKLMTGCGLIAAVIVGLIILGAIVGSSDKKPSGNKAASAESAPTPPPQALKVTAVELARAYDANEVAAQRAYGGQTLEITGTVTGVTLDFADDPVLQFSGINQFLAVQASFDKSYTDRLSGISKGQVVTVRCTSITEVISAPMLSDCDL